MPKGCLDVTNLLRSGSRSAILSAADFHRVLSFLFFACTLEILFFVKCYIFVFRLLSGPQAEMYNFPTLALIINMTVIMLSSAGKFKSR